MVTWRIEPLASPRQIDEILSIEEASFTNPWTREMYLADLDNRGVSYCFTAQGEDGHVVGFCSVWRVADEIHINNLAVKPEFRRTGVPTAPLTPALAEGARLGAPSATPAARPSNYAARPPPRS